MRAGRRVLFVLLGGALGQTTARVLFSDNTPFNVTNCSSRSAAIRNLTVYGTEILYTPPRPAGNGTVVVAAAANATTGITTSTSFEFQLYNGVLDVDAQCSTHVPQQNSSSRPAWHDCFVESRDTRITAAFQFDLAQHTLTIHETWVCDDGEASGSANGSANGTARTFQAWATNSIAVLCNETVNVALGQHYCARVPDTLLPVNVTGR
ncbi:hypothetical protein SCUCBS95973_009570 [Sporothrix curviconia]|uniref:AA1-like domain-containing protein n=1 Tax=Sporothrix curviconia TaxID=1260050 RepID=A0ABP0CYH0_9PEZI